MSAPAAVPSPISFEKLSIGSELNSTVLFTFLMALSLAETILLEEHNLPYNALVLADTIPSALFFTSLSSSLLATLLIEFKIHAVSKQNGGFKRRFHHVIEIAVLSAAVHSLSLLVLGISNAFASSSPPFVELRNYGVAVAFTITGITPTMMVARVCLAADPSTHVSTIHNLSGLQFRGRSTRQTATQIMVEDSPGMNVELVFTDKVTGVV
ncbi:hypothetical protein GALMADRAFT_144034 [Galerina marginata CBS 339.88]|uniref:Uncharacterized protein n=1 Tax=Galerina marginata (strain CBS 339.88) TaxID=685588 RepID=A0A067SX49_GALM3|nr:hypothetical protein GALMADRAFT_144034 [Galerina marginata CBS 339.88]